MQDEVTFDAPVKTPAKKRGKKAPAKKAAAKAAPAGKPKAPYPGLTRTKCADTCGATGCAISGKSYCAHPTKGGLQATDQSDPAALKRLHAARDQLDVKLDPDRFATV